VDWHLNKGKRSTATRAESRYFVANGTELPKISEYTGYDNLEMYDYVYTIHTP
jgi:hypothetical protein